MNSIPDLLRLLAIPFFAWAAWRDVETRRVPNRAWPPLAALAVVLLVWDATNALAAPTAFQTRWFAVRVAFSLGFVAPLAYLFWRLGGFGGADAKAFIVIAVLLPTFPEYQLLGTKLPLQPTLLGVFSLTVLSNTVLVGAAYPLIDAAKNALAGRFSPLMFVGVPVDWADVPDAHGRLLETPSGFTRRGLDLDALRMYLAWRGVTLAELRGRADDYRNPASLPAEPNPPGDGAVADGGTVDDPWGAAAFLTDIDHGAYGTSPADLRDGLDLLVREDAVWVSPGIPFLVPLFVGLVVAVTYGDLLFGALQFVGFA